MVYTSADIKHLEVMQALETTPKETSTGPSILEVSAQPTFESNLLKLADQLRSKGFDRYAAAIEEKFVQYKQAAKTHLYRTHNEDGEDLIQAAHPDGDIKLSDAKDDNGDVETLLSQHKKIVDVIRKQPTGKLAAFVQQCRIVLGAGTEDLRPFVDDAMELATNAINALMENASKSRAGHILQASLERLQTLAHDLSPDNLRTMQEEIIRIKAFAGTANQSFWQRATDPGSFSLMLSLLGPFIGREEGQAQANKLFWGGMQVDEGVVKHAIDQLNTAIQDIKDALKVQAGQVLEEGGLSSHRLVDVREIINLLNDIKTNLHQTISYLGDSAENVVAAIRAVETDVDSLLKSAMDYQGKFGRINRNNITPITKQVPRFAGIRSFDDLQAQMHNLKERLQSYHNKA